MTISSSEGERGKVDAENLAKFADREDFTVET